MEVPQTVTAAKKQSAAFDKPGLMALLRKEYSMPEAVSDEMLTKMLMEALSGAPEPDMPEAGTETPAVVPPELATASVQATNLDVLTVIAAGTAARKITQANVKAATEMAQANLPAFKAWLETAPVIAPEQGQVITATKADRKPASAAPVADQLTQIAQYASRNRTTIAAARAALNL